MDSLFTAVCTGVNCELIGTWVAALLTFCVFSYLADGLFGRRWDLAFRVATCLLVGTAIGFISAVVIANVLLPLIPRVLDDVLNLPGSWMVLLLDIIPIVLGVSLLMKLTPNFRGTTFSNVGLAYLFGIGAALAIGGALAGALVPQLTATMLSIVPSGDSFGWVNSLLIVVGTLGAFLAFRFIQPGTRPWQRAYETVTKSWGTLGRGFIMVAFGALLASVISARVSALVGQLYFLLHDWLNLI